MPLFDFTCRSCATVFEALVRPGHRAACPACDGTDLDRHPASFAVKTTERSRAAAAANRHKHAVQGKKDTAERETEAARHRREDH